MSTTIVTAFFDINRENNGDGRKLDEYLEWIMLTLQLNCNLVIFTESKFIEFMNTYRPSIYKDKTYIIEDTLENTSYYKYISRIQTILNDDTYKNKIKHPNRVECKIPEYNIIQYSKFGWLKQAINLNIFNSDYFFWMDIGCSRFFLDTNINNIYPNPNNKIINESNNKFIIQQRQDLQNYNIDENFIWNSDNLLKGTLFGGHKDIIFVIDKLLEDVFTKQMLEKDNVNNEQLGLTLVWKNNPELFNLIYDNSNNHLMLFKLLSA